MYNLILKLWHVFMQIRTVCTHVQNILTEVPKKKLKSHGERSFFMGLKMKCIPEGCKESSNSSIFKKMYKAWSILKSLLFILLDSFRYDTSLVLFQL